MERVELGWGFGFLLLYVHISVAHISTKRRLTARYQKMKLREFQSFCISGEQRQVLVCVFCKSRGMLTSLVEGLMAVKKVGMWPGRHIQEGRVDLIYLVKYYRGD